ncbi:unnamed protein product [Knipowitschia caucasica]
MDAPWLIRVIVTDKDIRRITLQEKPQNVESLIEDLQKKLSVDYPFSLQYEDPLFDNALCNVTDLAELPERPTLRVNTLSSLSLSPIATSSALSSTSSDDPIHLSQNYEMPRQDPWPASFDIPNFSVDVNYRLRQGDLAFLRDGTRIDVTRDMKHIILSTLAEEMYRFSPYPKEEDFIQVASALTQKHPCLKEAGSANGFSGWKNSLQFKMGNFRTKMRKAGLADVMRNKRLLANGESSFSKKPKRSETNFLPNFPTGETKESLETKRECLQQQAKRRFPDSSEVKKMMDVTFPFRRQEIVEEQPPVSSMLKRWPVLFTINQVAIFYD